MPEIRMPVGGVTPPTPATNEVSLYVKTDKRFYMQDDTGAEVKLLTDETTLAGLNVQLPLSSTGGSTPTIGINPVTTSSNGVMTYQDKLKLNSSTNTNTSNTIVERDAQGNFASNEITANLFNGVATSVVTIPSLSGDVTTDGITNLTSLSNGSISNSHISPTAAISIAKLDINPLNRANHTGVQDATTLSNFGTVVNTHLTSQSPIINNMISSNADIELSKLAENPLARANHTGTQLVSTISNFSTEVDTQINTYLTNNLITNSNIASNAAIAISKLAVNPLDRSNHTGTQNATTIDGIPLAVFNSLTEGNGVNFDYNGTTTTLEILGTASRIDVSSGAVDIHSSYIGQTSITTLGTVTTGNWNANTINVAFGGTGATSAGSASNNLIDVQTLSTSGTLNNNNNVVLVNASSGNLILDLPSASNIYKFTIKKIDNSANTVTVNVDPGDEIEGAASFTLSSQYEYKTVISNENTMWVDIT